MFSGCSSLTTLGVSNFDTSKVKKISYLFYGCSSLENIIFGSKFEKMDADLFDRCPKLKTIIVDENNPNYTSLDGVLYNKDLSVLIAYPQAQEKVIIPQSVTSIAQGVFASYYPSNYPFNGGLVDQKHLLASGKIDFNLLIILYTIL